MTHLPPPESIAALIAWFDGRELPEQAYDCIGKWWKVRETVSLYIGQLNDTTLTPIVRNVAYHNLLAIKDALL